MLTNLDQENGTTSFKNFWWILKKLPKKKYWRGRRYFLTHNDSEFNKAHCGSASSILNIDKWYV